MCDLICGAYDLYRKRLHWHGFSAQIELSQHAIVSCHDGCEIDAKISRWIGLANGVSRFFELGVAMLHELTK